MTKKMIVQKLKDLWNEQQMANIGFEVLANEIIGIANKKLEERIKFLESEEYGKPLFELGYQKAKREIGGD